ncbi:hypothetical protein IW261DRAFT_1291118, partial [Armillaria novae-zelandiae]
MNAENIGVLAVHETHYNKAFVDRMHATFGSSIKVYHSEMPQREESAGGVAIILNKAKTKTDNIVEYELIPGRALMLVLPWHNTLKVAILAVYAPNDPTENANFWEEINDKTTGGEIPRPDIICTDANMVEEMIDRLPMHNDEAAQQAALDTMKHDMGMIDGWRDRHPTMKAYTYHQKATGSQSHIDRIYVTEKILNASRGWEILETGIPTDHKLVSMELTDPQAPFVGPGRWPFPIYLARNEKFLAEVEDLGKKLLEDMDTLKFRRTNDENPQTLWKTWRYKVRDLARKAAKRYRSPLQKEVDTLKVKRDGILNDPSLNEEEKMLAATVLQE